MYSANREINIMSGMRNAFETRQLSRTSKHRYRTQNTEANFTRLQ